MQGQGRSPYTPPASRGKVTPPPRPRFTPASSHSSASKLPRIWPPGAGAAEGSAAAEAAGAAGEAGAAEWAGSEDAAPKTPNGWQQRQWQQDEGTWWATACAFFGAAADSCSAMLRSLDDWLRGLLRRNLHTLVSLLLIAGLLVGSTGLAAFLTVQVVQEGRASVLAVREVLPTAWTGVTLSGPLLPDEGMNEGGGMGLAAAAAAGLARGNASEGVGGEFEDVCPSEPAPLAPPGADGAALCSDENGAAADNSTAAAAAAAAGHVAASPGRGAAAVAAARAQLPSWLGPYQEELQGLVQRSLPGVAIWLEVQFDRFIERHNLTAAAKDLRLLYETLQVRAPLLALLFKPTGTPRLQCSLRQFFGKLLHCSVGIAQWANSWALLWLAGAKAVLNQGTWAAAGGGGAG